MEEKRIDNINKKKKIILSKNNQIEDKSNKQKNNIIQLYILYYSLIFL